MIQLEGVPTGLIWNDLSIKNLLNEIRAHKSIWYTWMNEWMEKKEKVSVK